MSSPRFLSPRLLPRLVASFVGAVSVVIGLHAQTDLPPGEALIGEPFASFSLHNLPSANDAVKLETVDADGPGFKRAWRIETLRDVAPMASIELRAVTTRAVAAGDVAVLRLYGRALETTDESGVARLNVVVRRAGPDNENSFELGVSFRSEWKEYVMPVRFHRDFAAGECAIMLRFGFRRQALELGGVDVRYYGKTRTYESLPRTRFTYAGHEPGAAWRTEAEARIEKIRRGDLAVEVVDAAGKPVPDAKVTVAETRAAFQFGSALQFARLVRDTPDNLIYRGKVLELFNAASPENDLKWVALVGDLGPNYSPQQSLAGLHWLKDHGVWTRGHVLIWPGWQNLPAFVVKARGTPHEKEIPGMVESHIRDVLTTTKGLVEEWDCLNEPYTNHALMDLFGRDLMVRWFEIAHETQPDLKFFFNDFSNHDASRDRAHVQDFEDNTQFLLEHGAPVGGLGLQMHIAAEPNAPEEILKVLDRYARFNLPVRVTEFDMATNDEELQADYTRDFFTALFSHPTVVGIQLWGFWESAHWRPSAAMYRKDWSEKPNGRVYRELVLQKWRTNLSGTTDAAGRFGGRGFHGDYRVIVEAGGQRTEQTFSLRPGEALTRIEVKLP